MTQELYLVRQSEDERGTYGELRVGSKMAPDLVFATIELPWKGNEPRVSRIPVGSYWCRLRDGYAEGSHFGYHHVHVLEIPGRSWILIHAGNKPGDTQGCILIGEKAEGGTIKNSRLAVSALVNYLDDLPRHPIRLNVS